MEKLFLLSKDDYEKHHAKYQSVMASGVTSENIMKSEPGAIKNMVCIIPVHGYISRYADFFNFMCGGCSQEEIRCNIESAVNDPNISRIVLEFDSPGGDATGTAELADYIRAMCAKKQIVAYVRGWACSAAYWLASSCSKIVAHKSAFVGSIGTLVCIDKPDGNEIIYTSTVTPNKNLDPASDAGRAEIMAMLDAMTGVFIGAVAEFRGVTPEIVTQNFGQGSAVFAENALQNGMVDISGALETACEYIEAEMVEQIQEPQNIVQDIAPAALRGKRKMGIKASLVVVDDTAEGVVIPNGTKVDELTAEWLKTNAPDVVKEIEDAAEAAETGRQGELDETAAAAETPAETEMVKAARKDRKMTAEKLSVKILAHRAGVAKAQKDEAAKLLAERNGDAGELNDLPVSGQQAEPTAITPEMRLKFIAQASGRQIH